MIKRIIYKLVGLILLPVGIIYWIIEIIKAIKENDSNINIFELSHCYDELIKEFCFTAFVTLVIVFHLLTLGIFIKRR